MMTLFYLNCWLAYCIFTTTTIFLDSLEEAIRKVRDAQNDYKIDELELPGIPISVSDVPIVHPRMVEIDFYNENSSDSLPSYDHVRNYLKYGKRVSYEKLVERIEKDCNYVCICGFPGAGKTTLSRRLKSSLKNYVCFLVCINDTNYAADEKMTLRDLLLNRAYPKLDDATCDDAFKWMIEHDDQCVIIFDGYDRAKWNMNKVPPKHSYSISLPINEIIASICRKHFLPKSRVILSSRPHSLIAIPRELRPKYSVIITDLTTVDMKELLFAFAESIGEQMWEIINKTAACLKSFCRNPLMLQLYVRASQRSLEQSREMLTMTRIFSAVLLDMKFSENSTNRDIEAVSDQLSRIAFNATNERRVCISLNDLEKEHLKVDCVQDLLVAFCDNQFPSNKKHFFTHQTLQEYYAARYIMLLMPLDDYKTFLKEQLFTDRWFMVRRYLCGLLVDINDEKCK